MASSICEPGQGYNVQDGLSYMSETQVLTASWRAVPVVHVTSLTLFAHGLTYMVTVSKRAK